MTFLSNVINSFTIRKTNKSWQPVVKRLAYNNKVRQIENHVRDYCAAVRRGVAVRQHIVKQLEMVSVRRATLSIRYKLISHGCGYQRRLLLVLAAAADK